jgi:hypothetical protein
MDFEKEMQLIDGSIKKWQNIVFNNYENRGTRDCPLCLSYHSNFNIRKTNCIGCPIEQFTGYSFCINTPYDAIDLLRVKELIIHSLGFKVAANHMLSFLYQVRLFWINRQRKNEKLMH